MKRIQFYLLIGVLSGLLAGGWSCRKKNYPESVTENSPVYFSKLTVNGAPVELVAGIDSYFMYSSVKQDSNQMRTFVGELKKVDCSSSCPQTLKIEINDYKFSSGGNPSVIDSSLRSQTYAYEVKSPAPAYAVQFISSFNRFAYPSSYQWSFGDGKLINDQNPTHVYNAGGKYEICLTVKSINGCSSSMCSMHRISKNGMLATVSSTATGQNLIDFEPKILGGKAPYTCRWNMGDGKPVLEKNGKFSYNYTYRGSYPVSLKVTDALGDTCSARFNAVTKNDSSSCAANYGIVSVSEVTFVQDKLSKIAVSWTDQNGTVYSSREGTQPSSSFFQVLSVQDNELNEKGERTKKLQVKFNCKVFNGTNMISIDNAEATICVGY